MQQIHHLERTMSTNIQVNKTQRALFQRWAARTNFKLDVYDSPKRQFSILAKHLDLIGGEEPWNSRWKACFGEEYLFGAAGECFYLVYSVCCGPIDGEDSFCHCRRCSVLW